MSQGKQAKIWDELFRLGLTKELVRTYLKPTKHQMRTIWEQPYYGMTFPQLQRLCSLVAPYYTIVQLADLIASDAYRPNSQMDQDMRKALAILLTEDGRKHFDEFKARKMAGKPRKNMSLAKKAKFDNNRKAFTRLSDPILEEESDLIEFITEHQRKSEGVYVPPPKEESEPSSGPSVKI